jgi:hypothetical protein
VLLVSSAVSGTLVASGNASPAADAINLLRVPLYMRDLVFLGRISPMFRLAELARGELLGAAVYVAVVGVSIATLLWRYRWAEA